MSAEASASPDAAATLHRLEDGTTIEKALSFFDSLPPVRVEEMIGAWNGSELKTGHRLNLDFRSFRGRGWVLCRPGWA